MKALRPQVIFILSLCILVVAGCSSSKSPIIPDQIDSLDSLPIIGLTDTGSGFSAIGLMGAYELTLNFDDLTCELVPKRTSSIGESWVVNGLSYFTISPCGDCLRIIGLAHYEYGITVRFEVKHPFEKGNPSEPPSARNRLDLEVFDLALVLAPVWGFAPFYQLTDATVVTDLIEGQDGYTTELAALFPDPWAYPYVLVIDESGSGSHTYNVFDMGATQEFDVFFQPHSHVYHFDLFLTMGYGSSATFLTRLDPKYYKPEFNRKAAWKVNAYPEGFWMNNNNTSTATVIVEVYDWQSGATISTEPNYADADPSHVFASSEVASVSAEIRGMTNSLQTTDTPVGGTGMPNDPLVYALTFANENLLPAGTYKGLVKVTDDRSVGQVPPSGDRDFLVHSTDGVELVYYTLNEFATYQTFDALVVSDCTGYCWTRTWGGPDFDEANMIATDNDGNVYVTGRFYETAQFNPDGGGFHRVEGLHDIYLSKFDSNGNWKWTRTWGGPGPEYGEALAVDSMDNIFVIGNFRETIQFDPDGGHFIDPVGEYDVFMSKFDSDGNWLGTITYGGTDYDFCAYLSINLSDEIFIAGRFRGTCDFDPLGGGSLTSNGEEDGYLSKFDSNGAWQWTKSWGGTSIEWPTSVTATVSGNAYVTGIFTGMTDFNPDGGSVVTSLGMEDCFISVFQPDGTWQTAESWGGAGQDWTIRCTSDSNEIIYIVGFFEGSSDFDPAGGAVRTSNGLYDSFVTTFDANAVWQWVETFGGPDYDVAHAIAVDDNNNLYLSGSFRGACDFNPAGGGIEVSNGIEDAFLSKFDTNGIWQIAKTWGSTDVDSCTSICMDQLSNVFATGYFTGIVEFNPDGVGWEQSALSSADCFVSKFNY